jgi:hypothetical protein
MPRHEPGGKGRNRQKGAQRHAEGQHGPKAHRAFMDQLKAGEEREARTDDRTTHDSGAGKHRLFEGRVQHDEADRNSEKNRLDRDISEHGHDRSEFQVRGGA